MKYGGKVCTILNNVLQKVTILLLTTYTILPEPPQQSGRTLIVYCVNKCYCSMGIGHIHLLAIMYIFILLFYTTMSECMIFFDGPILPEIN